METRQKIKRAREHLQQVVNDGLRDSYIEGLAAGIESINIKAIDHVAGQLLERADTTQFPGRPINELLIEWGEKLKQALTAGPVKAEEPQPQSPAPDYATILKVLRAQFFTSEGADGCLERATQAILELITAGQE